jgi:predicted Fe-Mo cluster-binding NifX family protein
MRVAVATWQERVAPVFDVAGHLALFEIAEGQVVSRSQATLPSPDFPGKVRELVELGVDRLICGAISRPALDQVRAAGIEIHPFVSGALSDVLAAWLAGRLARSEFAMPGCGRRSGCRRGAGGAGRGRPWWCER